MNFKNANFYELTDDELSEAVGGGKKAGDAVMGGNVWRPLWRTLRPLWYAFRSSLRTVRYWAWYIHDDRSKN